MKSKTAVQLFRVLEAEFDSAMSESYFDSDEPKSLGGAYIFSDTTVLLLGKIVCTIFERVPIWITLFCKISSTRIFSQFPCLWPSFMYLLQTRYRLHYPSCRCTVRRLCSTVGYEKVWDKHYIAGLHSRMTTVSHVSRSDYQWIPKTDVS